MVAGSHPEQVRKLINRLLYLLNEDSGSNGWGAAAALGEIGRHQIALVKEIIPMFVGFLEEPFSQEPMLWGVGRLAEVHPELLDEVLPVIVPFLTSPGPSSGPWPPGGWAKPGIARPPAPSRPLTGDDHPVELYDHGRSVADHRGPDGPRGPGGSGLSRESQSLTIICAYAPD